MKSLSLARQDALIDLSHAQRYLTVLQSTKVEDAYEKANTEQRKVFSTLVERQRITMLRDWANAILKQNLDDLTVLELRCIAAPYHIRNMHRLPKCELVKEIKDARRKHAERFGSNRPDRPTHTDAEIDSRSWSGDKEIRETDGQHPQETTSKTTTDTGVSK